MHQDSFILSQDYASDELHVDLSLYTLQHIFQSVSGSGLALQFTTIVASIIPAF